MSTILLAVNRIPTALTFGHLQLVSSGTEIEVQSPDIPVVGLQDWVFERIRNRTDPDNTPGVNDPYYYDSVEIDCGDRSSM
jgi:hypothetical protein